MRTLREMTAPLAHTDRGEGHPVVFLHGITANRRHWAPAVELLVDRYRCINVDALGHGESPRGEGHNLFAQVDALAALVEHLGLHGPVVVGHSAGAFAATVFATGHPASGVVNIDQRLDTTAFGEEIRPYEQRLRSGDDAQFQAAFAEFVEHEEIGMVPEERQALARYNIRPTPEVVLDMWTTVFDTPPHELKALIEGMLPGVSAPYLAVFGSPISEEERRLLGLIPESRVEVWEGLGHFVPLVDPDRTAARIAAFVDEVTG